MFWIGEYRDLIYVIYLYLHGICRHVVCLYLCGICTCVLYKSMCLLFACVYVYMSMYVHWVNSTIMCVCRGQRSIFSVFRIALFMVWGMILHWTQSSPFELGWPVSELSGSTCLHLTSSGITDRSPTPGFFLGRSWGSELRSSCLHEEIFYPLSSLACLWLVYCGLMDCKKARSKGCTSLVSGKG